MAFQIFGIWAKIQAVHKGNTVMNFLVIFNWADDSPDTRKRKNIGE